MFDFDRIGSPVSYTRSVDPELPESVCHPGVVNRAAVCSPSPKFFVVGSGDAWRAKVEMDCNNGKYRYKGHLARGQRSFKIIMDGSWDHCVYPSQPNSSLALAHVLKGPNQGGHNYHWQLPPGSQYEIVLHCPRGRPLSISWSRTGGPSAKCSIGRKPCVPDKDDKVANSRLMNTYFGKWRLCKELGRGEQQGAVFRAQGPQRFAALKYPVSLREIQHLGAMSGVPGVPQLLDCGTGPDNGMFLVTPELGPSLDHILGMYNEEGQRNSGKLPWEAARFLGEVLLQTLEGIHARGLVHCDIKLGNVLVGTRDASPYLIDFGLSHPLGSAYFNSGAGTLEFNSIRAGFPGERTAADDLESLGWMLCRCVVGKLPWQADPNQIDWTDRKQRQILSESMSRAKEEALNTSSLNIPHELIQYLLYVRALDCASAPEIDYMYLRSLFYSPFGKQDWAAFVADYRWEQHLDQIYEESSHCSISSQPEICAYRVILKVVDTKLRAPNSIASTVFHVTLPVNSKVACMRAALQGALPAGADILGESADGAVTALRHDDILPEQVVLTDFVGCVTHEMVLTVDQVAVAQHMFLYFLKSPDVQQQIASFEAHAGGVEFKFRMQLANLLMKELYPSLLEYFGLSEVTSAQDVLIQVCTLQCNTLPLLEKSLEISSIMKNSPMIWKVCWAIDELLLAHGKAPRYRK